MIKCNNTVVCGTICRAPQVKTNNEGKEFMTFGVNVVIFAKSGINKTITISVAKDGGDRADLFKYVLNARVEVKGTMTFRKKDDNLYFNLSAQSIDVVDESHKDAISGEMEFRGTVGKSIQTKTDKKGNPFMTFSAYSCEKNGEDFVYTWVNFVDFNDQQPNWLEAKMPINAKGDMSMSVYNDRMDINCRVSEISKREKFNR